LPSQMAAFYPQISLESPEVHLYDIRGDSTGNHHHSRHFADHILKLNAFGWPKINVEVGTEKFLQHGEVRDSNRIGRIGRR